MVDNSKVLEIVKRKGPILPVQIRKEIDGADTITIGAVLSELASNDKLQISHTKVGGSPVYYVPEQRAKLQDLREQLNDKQQKAFDLLKENKVLRDDAQEPVIRASLRAIKDFAKPLEVETGDGDAVYWKWYLTNNEEAEKLIREDLGDSKSKKAEKKKEEKAEKEEQQRLSKEKEEEKESKKEEPGEESGSDEEEGEDEEYEREETDDDFMKQVRKFFDKNDVEILEENSIRKGSDLEFIINMPTPVGKQKYFCKARGKKKCNDGDLSSAYIKGQSKKLPVLFLYTGDITNKAEDMLEEEFKGMLCKKV